MLDRIKSEPALVSGGVQAILGLLLAFGVDMTNAQTGAILAVTAAVLALFVRAAVTPTVKSGDDYPNDELGWTTVWNVIVVVGVIVILLILIGALHVHV